MVELKGYKVNRLEIENKAKPGTQLKLQNQVKYNMNYIQNGNAYYTFFIFCTNIEECINVFFRHNIFYNMTIVFKLK